ncbi:Protein of unknown function [Lactobacillus delbrueckii subsp. lactis]|nr:Putative uncharacterized protein [Lactobacillus delbrueckii subsp. lactis]CDR81499.1 Protein of unknown function [Lactobacillus delbrueckii subsp. lactis]CDR83007.1 Protein of unknown function [Lactobacillus delbrueckii subsp. lactis]CDR85539.1 Protein of unknown function [Lactobacillus delbrueckii subsp. lactis]
MTNLAQLT